MNIWMDIEGGSLSLIISFYMCLKSLIYNTLSSGMHQLQIIRFL